MLSWNVTPAPGILGPFFLWRLLIDERHQRHGFGGEALTRSSSSCAPRVALSC